MTPDWAYGYLSQASERQLKAILNRWNQLIRKKDTLTPEAQRNVDAIETALERWRNPQP